VFFSCRCRASTSEEQLLGIALRLVKVKCLVEILKLFFALSGNAYRMACRYREDIVVVMLN
jgi:hypothetical protein